MASDYFVLEKASNLLNSNDKESIEKSYNTYKTLYIRSILENDKNLKKEALKGIVKSCKKLKIDCKDYEQELKKIEPYILKKENSFNIVKKNRKNRLKIVKLKKRLIEFYFDFDIKDSDIKRFSLIDKKRSIYKKIFDIKGVWPYKKREYKLKSIKKIKIAQFDKKNVRLVFEDIKPIKIEYKIDKNILKVYFLDSNKKDKKEYVVKKYTPIFNKNRIIVIDPGHGGKDAGAVGYKRKKEKDVVLAVAKKLYKELKKRGYKAYLTRTKDYFVKLRNRTKYANIKMADIFISIHANAAPKKSKYLSMRGIETFFLSPARSQRAKRVAALENRADLNTMGYFSKLTFLNFLNREKIISSNKLAIDVQKGMLYNLRKHYRGVVDGGVREGPFWVLVGAQMPAILVEIGYITNPTEAKRIFNPYYQNLLVKGIADGIDNYFLHNL